MEQEATAAGDYGYDMAHREAEDHTRPARRGERDAVGPSPTVGKPGLEDDFGYDEAHGF